VINKIRIDGFPHEVEPFREHGLGWWRDLREELKKNAPALLARARAAPPRFSPCPTDEIPPPQPPSAPIPGRPPTPIPIEPPRPSDEGRSPVRWMDPVFPSLVALPPPPQSVAWMRPLQPS
jgi:hypothetical protein